MRDYGEANALYSELQQLQREYADLAAAHADLQDALRLLVAASPDVFAGLDKTQRSMVRRVLKDIHHAP